MKVKLIVLSILLLLLTIPTLAMAAGEGMHFFDCKECHLAGLTITALQGSPAAEPGSNLCLKCHSDSSVPIPMNPNRPHPNSVILSDGLFISGDASNQYNTAVAGEDNSHNWSSSPTNAEAGATNPSRTLHPTMSGKQGRNTASVNCARCHNPHGAYDVAVNPSLLVDSDDRSTTMATDDLCTACHTDFSGAASLPGNEGLLTHPLLNSTELAAITGGNPAYNMTGLQNYNVTTPYANNVELVDDGVSCMSCHGLHFTDSNSSTPDGPGTVGTGDGLLLRSDGPTSTGGNRKATAQLRSNLCQSCHTYKTHGDSASTHNIGCLDCHGGHEYDAVAPNYFMLKKQVTLAFVPKLGSGGTVALEYTVDPTITSDYTNGTGINGCLCLNCHNLPGTHNASANCGDCHGHNSLTGSFSASCGFCHGYAPSLNGQGNLTSGGYAFGNITGNDYASSGVFKDESATPHSRHANGAGNYTFSCADCHGDGSGVLSDLPGAGKHDGGTFQQVLDNGLGSLTSLTSADGTLSSAYNAGGSGSCSAVYCHSNGRVQGRPDSALIETVTAGPWANGVNTISACNVCHDVQLGGSKNHSPSHNIHLTKGYTCGTCHNDTSVDGSSLVAAAIGCIHVDGTVDVTFSGTADLGVGGVYDDTQGTCVTYCHSDGDGTNAETPDWDDANTGNCGDCHGGPSGADSVIVSGSHTKHISNGFSCVDCHGAGAQTGSHAGHLDGDGPATYDVPVDCNICHGATGGVTVGADREPIWGNSTSVDCETCHAGSVISDISGAIAPDKNEALTSGHNLVTGNYAVTNNSAAAAACTDCHDAASAGHFDASGDDRLIGGFDCLTCHDGIPATQILTHTNIGATIKTEADFTKTCLECHDPHGDASNAAMINVVGVVFTARTNVNSFDEADAANADDLCATCHVNTIHNNTVATGSHNENANCTSCHGHDGGFMPTGGSSCEDCHSVKLAQPRHAAHIDISPTVDTDLSDCVICHPSSSSYTIVGGSPDHFNNSGNDFAAGITNPEAAGTTCSSAMCCHQSSVADGSWQDSDGLNCDACHGADIDAGLNGVHGSHTDTVTFLAGKKVSSGDYGSNGWYTTSYVNGKPNFGCGECHPAGEGTGHPTAGLNIDLDPAGESPVGSRKALNVDGPSTPTFSTRASVTCRNIYCHSDAAASPTYATTPNWYGGTVSGNCDDCHGNGPSTNAHSLHVVGIHYEELYDDDGDGLMPAAGVSGAAHGDAGTSDPIGCQTCHNATVTVEFNDANVSCSTCHNGSPQGSMVINTAGSTHVNGVKNVIFDDLSTFKSKAQLRDDIESNPETGSYWDRTSGTYKDAGGSSFDTGSGATVFAAGSCSTVACHFGNTANWTDSGVDCMYCHTQLPK
jgi:predicted CxxxxCH...CXXCH cytochrome family protein